MDFAIQEGAALPPVVRYRSKNFASCTKIPESISRFILKKKSENSAKIHFSKKKLEVPGDSQKRELSDQGVVSSEPKDSQWTVKKLREGDDKGAGIVRYLLNFLFLDQENLPLRSRFRSKSGPLSCRLLPWHTALSQIVQLTRMLGLLKRQKMKIEDSYQLVHSVLAGMYRALQDIGTLVLISCTGCIITFLEIRFFSQ
jgi:hypothetical protein